MHVPGSISHQHTNFEQKQTGKNVLLFSYISEDFKNWVEK
jgi:hypothetical protein